MVTENPPKGSQKRDEAHLSPHDKNFTIQKQKKSMFDVENDNSESQLVSHYISQNGINPSN
jgi:hypothetical protein